MTIKPRFRRKDGNWECSGGGATGYGHTFSMAYFVWQMARTTKSRTRLGFGL